MNEDKFNMSVRRFLKEVGVTSQREIEKAIAKALESKQLPGKKTIHAKMTLQVPELDLSHVIEGSIDLS